MCKNIKEFEYATQNLEFEYPSPKVILGLYIQYSSFDLGLNTNLDLPKIAGCYSCKHDCIQD